MKTSSKLLLSLFVALFFAGMANAQLRFGIKAGLNIDNLRLNHTSAMFNKDNQCGYTLGAMTEFQIPVIGLCFDLSAMYTRMNSDFDVVTSSGTTVSPVCKNFLEIPLNLKYKLPLPVVGRIITPYLLTGPSFAIRLDKNTLDAFKTKTCQTSWNVGAGIELLRHLQLTAQYGIGMNNIAKHWVNSDNIKIKNNYWTVTAAYLF